MTPAAVLSILVKTQGVGAAQAQLTALDRSAKGAGTGLTKTNKAFALTARAAVGAAAGIGGLVVVGTQLIKTYEESAKVGRQTNAVLKSTGGVANVTAKEVSSLADAISRKTGIDDEAVQSAENLLLTFKNIRNEAGAGRDIFNQATQAAVDLSAAGFGSLSSASKQLGKALNDPVKGMTALGRAGVTFSEQQKTAIAKLMETGTAADRVRAQQIVLREVMSQVGGSAAANGTAFQKLRVTLENIAETLGGKLAPAVERAATSFNRFLLEIQDGRGAGGKFAATARNVAGAVTDLTAAFKSVANAVRPITSRVLPAIGSAAADAAAVFRGLARTIRRLLTGDIAGAFDAFKGTVRSAMSYAVNIVKAATAPMRVAGKAVGAAIFSGIKAGITGAAGLVGDIGHAVAKWLNDNTPFGDSINVGPLHFRIPALARGGAISGGVPGRDSVPAMLMPGEHVWTAAEVARAGGHSAMFEMRKRLGGGTQAMGMGMAAGGAAGGTWDWANSFAKKYGLRITSSFRTPSQNAAAGGVPNSWHTRGSASNPQAFDFVPPSKAAAAAARAMGAAEVLIHNAGSGLHLHVGGPPSGAISAAATGGGAGFASGAGSWFNDGQTKSGKHGAGIAVNLPGLGYRGTYEKYAGKLWDIIAPNGRRATLPQVDEGPSASATAGAFKGKTRLVDFLPAALARLGYTTSNFPTDATFKVKPHSAASTAKKMAAPAKMIGGMPAATFKKRQAAAQKTFVHNRGVARQAAGVRRSVNANRATNAATAVDNAYLLSTLTPGTVDDLAAASAALGFYDTRVKQYSYGLKYGDKRVTGDMLREAVSSRDQYQGYISDLSAPAPAATGSDSATDTASQVASLLQDIKAELAAQNKRADAITGTVDGTLAHWVTEMISGRLGTSAALTGQVPSSPGLTGRL